MREEGDGRLLFWGEGEGGQEVGKEGREKREKKENEPISMFNLTPKI